MRRVLAPLALLLAAIAAPAPAQTPVPPPVAVVVDERLPVGGGVLPVAVSADWSKKLPAIRRAVVVVHGYQRNAADYMRNMAALAPPDTLVVAPQFLAAEDIAAHRLPDTVLRWQYDLWSSGYPALGPSPLSSFAALDAVVGKLTDRAILPNLTNIVVAGFSAGGQVVQRYAVVGAAGGGTAHLRYVVGSPSSYAYFGDERPSPDGSFAAFAGAAACPGFNRWKYGFAGDMPSYVASAAALGTAALERRYAQRDVIYLVGSKDTDPNHRLLDKSCAGEAQGPTRLARMQFYFADLKRRDAGVPGQQMHIVEGPGHNEARVFGSPCGRAALFGDAGC